MSAREGCLAGGYLPREMSAQGMSAHGVSAYRGICPGVSPERGVCQTPPVNRMTDRQV